MELCARGVVFPAATQLRHAAAPSGASTWLLALPCLRLGRLGSGLFAGGNYQFNRLVIGAEGDWQWSRLAVQPFDLKASGFVNVATNSTDAGNRTPISDIRFGLAYKFGDLPTAGKYW